MGHSHHCLAEKVQALTLLEWGMPPRRVAEVTNFSARQLYRLQEMARKRGYDPSVSLVIKDEHLAVAPRSGRPRKIRPEKEGAVVAGADAQKASERQRGQSGMERGDNDKIAASELARCALDQVSGALPMRRTLGDALEATKDIVAGK